MTVTAQPTRNTSVAAVGATDFPYSFKIVDKTHLLVQVDGVTKAVDSDYTVTGVGNDAGGDIAFLVPLDGGETVMRRRNMPIERLTDYQNLGDLRSPTLNNDQDAPVLMIQQVAGDVGRALKLGDSDTDGSGTYAANGNKIGGLANGVETTDAATYGQVLDEIVTAIADPNKVLFLPAGASPAPRTVGAKLRDLETPYDRGAAGNGTTNDSAALTQAFIRSATYFPDGAFVSRNVFVEGPSFAFGPGRLLATTANESQVIVADPDDENALVQRAIFMSLAFGPMPAASSDNWAGLHFNTAEAGIAAFNRFDDSWTGIRSGYYLGGAVSRDNLFLGNYMVGAANIGIECIESQHNRIIGNAMHNDGVPIGLHGIRWSGGGIGNIAIGNSLRDRGTTGLSLQVGNTHGLFVGNYVENSASHGVRADSVDDWEGMHWVGPTIIKDAGGDGIEVETLSHCVIQALIDGCADVGLRTDGDAAVGRHMIDAFIKDAGSSAALIRSDKNLVRLLVDNNTAGTPVLVSGSNNLVIVLCADTTVSNTVYITGSNNVVILQESGSGAVGLRIDGSNNAIFGKVTGNVTFVGDNNRFDGVVAGNLTVNAGADGNSVAGVVVGSVTNNGAGSNFMGLAGGHTRGSTTDTTDASGNITITHGAKRAPAMLNAVIRGTSPRFCTLVSTNATTATFRVWEAVTGTAVASTSVVVDWQAII